MFNNKVSLLDIIWVEVCKYLKYHVESRVSVHTPTHPSCFTIKRGVVHTINVEKIKINLIILCMNESSCYIYREKNGILRYKIRHPIKKHLSNTKNSPSKDLFD